LLLGGEKIIKISSSALTRRTRETGLVARLSREAKAQEGNKQIKLSVKAQAPAKDGRVWKLGKTPAM